jgi:anti-sigma-K factor RskA
VSDHDTWRESAAAYVLGALDGPDRAGFEAHLESCERCREEVVSLAPLPGLLARVDPDEVDEPTGPPVDAVVAAVRDEVAGVERSRRRWRWLASAAAACLVVLGGVTLASALTSDDARDEDRGVQLALSEGSGVTGAIVADQRSWGTYVHVSLEDLPPADGYELWVVDLAGEWHPAGTWAPTPDGAANLGGSSELALADIDRIVVTTTARGEEILEAS